MNEAEKYGLTFYGDGATIKRSALFNIMAAGVHNPAAILSIKDTYHHMSEGNKKDASYIASIVKNEIQKLDPEKTLTDLIYFDGAANVQKAGQILTALYPRATCLHAIEHGVSLFFADISKIPQVRYPCSHIDLSI